MKLKYNVLSAINLLAMVFLLSGVSVCLWAAEGNGYEVPTGNNLLSGGGSYQASSSGIFSQDDSIGLISAYSSNSIFANESAFAIFQNTQPTGSVTINSMVGDLLYATQNVLLSFSASDQFNIVSYNISNTANVEGPWFDVSSSGMLVGTSIITANLSGWTLSAVDGGQVTVFIKFRNRLGVVGPAATDTITYINNAPRCVISNIAPLVNGVVTTTVTVFGLVTDNFGVANWTLRIDGGQILASGVTENISGILTSNWDTSSLAEGLRTLTLTATNLSDLIRETTYAVTVDHTVPTALLVSALPNVNGLVSGSLVTVRGTVTDNIGLASWSLNVGVTVLASDTSATVNGVLTTNWNTASLSDGPVTLSLSVTDLAGYTTLSTFRVTIDNTAPVIAGVTINNGDLFTDAQRVTLNLSATDAITQATGLTMLIAGNVATIAGSTNEWVAYTSQVIVTLNGSSGVNTINVSIRDEVGNISSGLDTITYTNTNPTALISNIAPAVNGIVTATVAVSGKVTDNFGVASWILSIDGGQVLASGVTENISGTLTSNWNTTIVPEGVRTLTLTATNISGLSSQAYYTVTIDHTSPAAQLLSVDPVVNQTIFGKAVSILGTITDNIQVNSWILKAGTVILQSGTSSTVNGVLVQNTDTTLFAEGATTLSLTVVDGGGLATTGYFRITVDNLVQPPLLSCSDNMVTSNIVRKLIAVSANELIKEISFFENGVLLVTTSVAELKYFPVTVNLTSTPGVKVIKALVVDLVGNISLLSEVGLTFNIAEDVREAAAISEIAGVTVGITIPAGVVDYAVIPRINIKETIASQDAKVPTMDNIYQGTHIQFATFIKAVEIELFPANTPAGQAITTFNGVLEVVLSISPPMIDTQNIRVYYFNHVTNAWSAEGITLISVSSTKVIFTTNHLSYFAVASIVTDAIPPGIISLKLDDNVVVTGDFVSAQPTVNLSVTDNVGLKSYRIIVYDSQNNAVPGNDSSTINIQNFPLVFSVNRRIEQMLASGTYAVKVIVADAVKAAEYLTGRFIVSGELELILMDVLPAPNPFNPDKQVCHIGYQLNVPATVKLYIHTKAGDLIYQHAMDARTGYNEFVWDGRYDYGKMADNGGYLGYVIAEANGKEVKRLVKIAVLR